MPFPSAFRSTALLLLAAASIALALLAADGAVRALAMLLAVLAGAGLWLLQRQREAAVQARQRSAERLYTLVHAEAPLPQVLEAAGEALRHASNTSHVLIYHRRPGTAEHIVAHQSGSPRVWPAHLQLAESDRVAQVRAVFAAAGWPNAAVFETASADVLAVAPGGVPAHAAGTVAPVLHLLRAALSAPESAAEPDAAALIAQIAPLMQLLPELSDVAAAALSAALTTTATERALLLVPQRGSTSITRFERDAAGQLSQSTGPASPQETALLGLRAAARLDDAALLPGMRAGAAVPLARGGVLAVFAREPLSEQRLRLLAGLAECAGAALRSQQMKADLSMMGSMLRLLHDASSQMAGVMDAQAICRILVRLACDQVRVDIGALYTVSSEDSQIAPQYALGCTDADSVLMAAAAGQHAKDSALANTSLADGRTLITMPMGSVQGIRHVLCLICAPDRVPDECDHQTLGMLAQQSASYLDTIMFFEQVRNSTNRIRALLNSARDGIILLDREGRLLECNPAAERLLGLERDEVLQQHLVTVLMHMMEGDTPVGLGYSRSELTMLARQLRLEPQRITRREFRRQGLRQTVYVEEIGGPVRSDSGEIIGRLMIFRDITEHHLAAQYRDEITRMMVHDLRGPLWAVETGIQLALSEITDDAQHAIARTTLDVSLQSTRDLMRIVDSLLDIGRLERREMPLRRVRSTPARLIRAAQTTLEPSFNAAGITVSNQCQESLPDVLVDEDVIRRVLVNLLDNALRYTPQGGQITISSSLSSTELRLTIADSGPGIPLADRERVFERFQQVRGNVPQRGSKGSGLGLTFCKLAIEAHGGHIWVEGSPELGGAAFNVTLPLAIGTETREVDKAAD